MIRSPLAHSTIRINGIDMHIVEAGPLDGQPMILLHGFPEFWYSWRHQIDALTAGGFRLIIPDQRGYNLTEKPDDITAYCLDRLADDIIGLIDYAGVEKAWVVGHDWGGAAAWWTANKFPERIDRLAVLNIPHHAAFSRALRENPAQRRKSWYMAFFQLPALPEVLISAANGALFARWAFGHSPAFDTNDIRRYKRAWSHPGAVTAMLNWYRAVRQTPPERLESPRITPKTLLIWGRQDQVFEENIAQKSVDLCDDGQLVYIDNSGHWVQHEAAEQVNKLLLDFFTA
ncbi:MAG: alpha/beta fold hydrolase [Chloroflexota bacterium]